jgi:hypothetical protein
MADFSNTRINMALFQQLEQDRKSDKSPQATGSIEISVADLNEFFSLALALEPVDNWKGEPVIKLRCGVWHRETKNGKPWESISVSPERGAEFKEEDLATPHTAAQPVAAGVADDEEL